MEVDGEAVSNLADLTAIMESKAVGDEITVTASAPRGTYGF